MQGSGQAQAINRAQAPTRNNEEFTEPMALSTATRDWLNKNDLERFIQVADAPPHEEPEKVSTMINLDEISEGIV
mgnify:CR=1 FL=1